MAVRNGRCRRLTVDSASIEQQISQLGSMRARGHLRSDGKQSIVRVFYALHRDSRIRTPSLTVDAKKRTESCSELKYEQCAVSSQNGLKLNPMKICRALKTL